MKKISTILCILLAIAACSKQILNETPELTADNQGIIVNLTINRTDNFPWTKATVKDAWADNDVIFVFFKGVAAPKYLEMKYASGVWISTSQNGLVASDLSDAVEKKMTAIYLPYGSDAAVVASGTDFVFDGLTYSGVFLQAESVTYTYDSELKGTLNMVAPTLANAGDKFIHFDVTGYTTGHDYVLYQNYVKPLTFMSVSADGVISKTEGAMGKKIKGYEDTVNSIISFSGILDYSVVGSAVDYQFSIDDRTSSFLYTRDAGTKTLSDSKYIGIGAMNNSAVWTATEYVDLGLSVKWAKANLGAADWTKNGDYYAWGEVEPYYTQLTPYVAWKDGKSNGYAWASYSLGDGETFSKYSTGTSTNLAPEDDAATYNLKGIWRIPSSDDYNELRSNCTFLWTQNVLASGFYGYQITSNVVGYTENYIALPAANQYVGTSNGGLKRLYYWLSTSWSYDGAKAYGVYLTDETKSKTGRDRYEGNSIRPVFTVD